MLSREAILKQPVLLRREPVEVPEWGGTVNVRVLTGTERDALEVRWEDTKRKNFRARLVVATVCDDDGRNLFTEGDIPALGSHSSAAIQVIFDVATRINKFTKEDVAELEKNSESGPSDASA